MPRLKGLYVTVAHLGSRAHTHTRTHAHARARLRVHVRTRIRASKLLLTNRYNWRRRMCALPLQQHEDGLLDGEGQQRVALPMQQQ